jgi:hypothetical protein
MATLGDLKTRIIAETLRDDLADDMAASLTLLIQKSIEQYASVRWWFNEARGTTYTVLGSQNAVLPPDFRYGDDAKLDLGGVNYSMLLRQPVEIDDRYTAGAIQGQPTEYAYLGSSLYLWPTPNRIYPVLLRYVANVSPALDFTDDTSANFWTNEGQDLITARVKLRLYRDYLSAALTDPRVVASNNQEQDAYTILRSAHNRRISTGRVRAGFG